jgi:DNA mismatch repair protein MutL
LAAKIVQTADNEQGMSSIIQRLDPKTINQIAAGEVIINPASVVKELVDNALDAGSTKIRVEVKGGGRQLIRVADNGSGMGASDAKLCFELHATSKLNAIDDLETLSTMGFRGEALASIGAIAKVTMKTRLKGESLGTFVAYEGGELLRSDSIPCDEGTLIAVEDLFYNIPARRKFLKSPRQEHAEIQKCLSEMALSHVNVSFQLVLDDLIALDLLAVTSGSTAERLRKRSREILQLEESDWIEVDFNHGELSLQGLISAPSIHRPQRTGQYLFLNRRPIQPWPLSQAVMQGYGALLPEGRYPLFMLNLALKGSEFDVNVHPQKREVRFRYESELRERIRNGIAASFHKTFKPAPAWECTPSVYHVPQNTFQQVCETIEIPMQMPLVEVDVPQVVGTIPGYILLERSPQHSAERGLCFVNQKRARARIAFEKTAVDGRTASQELLLPLILHLDLDEQIHWPEMSAHGFLGTMRSAELTLTAVPQWAIDDPEGALREYLAGNERKVKDLCEGKESRMLIYDAMSLMRTLMECKEPYYSPQGKPIFAWVPQENIERLFS